MPFKKTTAILSTMAFNIGISGKRYFKDSHKTLEESIKSAIDIILDKDWQKEFTGFTMLATGTDSIFASLVLDTYNQPIHVILPFPQEVYEQDFTDLELTVFHGLLVRAANVTILNKHIPKSNDERNLAYREAGLEIVKKADRMIFVWDEVKPTALGGTADILSYYSENYPAENWQLIKVQPKEEAGLQKRLDAAFNKSNKNARKSQQKHNTVWRFSLFLGWFAVCFFSIKDGFCVHGFLGWVLTAAETVSVIVAFCQVLYGIKKAYHKNCLKQRIRAEQLRLLQFFFHVGTAVSVPIASTRDDEELRDLVNDVNNAAANKTFNSKWYNNFQIKELVISQLKYHTDKIEEMGKKPETFIMGKNIVAFLFVINVVVHFVFSSIALFNSSFEKLNWSCVLEHITTTLTIFLPGTYALIEGILFFKDWEKIKGHSEFARKTLEDYEKEFPKKIWEIDDTVCMDQQFKLIHNLAATMLNDNVNWQIIFEEKSDYHWLV